MSGTEHLDSIRSSSASPIYSYQKTREQTGLDSDRFATTDEIRNEIEGSKGRMKNFFSKLDIFAGEVFDRSVAIGGSLKNTLINFPVYFGIFAFGQFLLGPLLDYYFAPT